MKKNSFLPPMRHRYLFLMLQLVSIHFKVAYRARKIRKKVELEPEAKLNNFGCAILCCTMLNGSLQTGMADRPPALPSQASSTSSRAVLHQGQNYTPYEYQGRQRVRSACGSFHHHSEQCHIQFSVFICIAFFIHCHGYSMLCNSTGGV